MSGHCTYHNRTLRLRGETEETLKGYDVEADQDISLAVLRRRDAERVNVSICYHLHYSSLVF